LLLTKKQGEYMANLAAFFVAVLLGSLLYFNTVDLERLQEDRKQVKQELEYLRQLLEERTHPATMQKRQIEYLLHEGDFKE
jgi:hypothetical protein